MNTYMTIRKNRGVLIWLISFAAALVLFSVKSDASEAQSVMLTASGDRAEIALNFPQAAAEEISSLQISLRVSVNSDKARVEFIQSELPAKIVESRYHSDTNMLNIYIAGTQPLFGKSNPILSLGYVKISGEGSAAADVEIVENSLKFVRGTELVVQDSGVDYPAAVRISYSHGGAVDPIYPIDPVLPSVTDKPDVTQTPSVTEKTPETENSAVTEKPELTDKPDVTENSPQTEKPKTEGPAVTDTPDVTDNSSVIVYPPLTEGQGGDNPPSVSPGNDVTLGADTSALLSAINVAESLEGSEYSEKSYGNLTAAVDNAKAILNNIYATQDEIDEALLVVENAIGMLELRNTPSREDVTDSAEPGSQGGGGQNEPQVTDRGGDGTSEGESGEPNEEQNQPSSADNNDNGESGSADGISPWVIVLIIICVLLAAAFAALFITAAGKKKGKHSRKK